MANIKYNIRIFTIVSYLLDKLEYARVNGKSINVYLKECQYANWQGLHSCKQKKTERKKKQ